MTTTSETRERARPTGGRTLEIHAATPALNAWYYGKLRSGVAGRVLELGSGIGNITRLLAADATQLIATDVEDDYLSRLREEFAAQPRVTVERFDLEGAVPAAIAAERFDAIVSLNVLEHVADDAGAVRRLVALLAPGGRLLTYVPAIPLAFGSLDDALGHHRRYDARSLRVLMEQAGLRVERLEYMNVLGLAGWWLNGRILKRRMLDPRQVAVFEKLLPLVRLEERVRLPFGLGLVCHARRTG